MLRGYRGRLMWRRKGLRRFREGMRGMGEVCMCVYIVRIYVLYWDEGGG